jgi:polar amino acid transport system substrate-binding protein
MSKLSVLIRRRWCLAVAMGLIVVVAGVFLATRFSFSRRDETWERIQREGSMRVGMDASYPPFDLLESDGGFVGYDVDLALELGARLGIEVEFVDIFFDGLYDALLSGRVDLIVSALPHDRLLTQDVAYSYSYFNAGQVLVVAQRDDRIGGIEDLAGLRVAVELGSAAHQEARRLNERERLALALVTRRTPEEVVDALAEGQADAAIYDGIAARQVLSQGKPIKIVGGPLTDEPYVIALRLDSPLLLEKVNEALVEFREQGFLGQLEEKWF